MAGRGPCVAGGHALQGVCMTAGMHGGGMCGGVICGGGCAAGETATAVDSTHPTGMHSCFICSF